MKRGLLFAIAAFSSMAAFSQMEEIEGVPVLLDFYCQKTSHDGTQLVGESDDGSTVYYNLKTGQYYKYSNCNWGNGYDITDSGWIVGCQLLDVENQTTRGVIMRDGEIVVQKVLGTNVSSNIHGITPDGKRACGVVGNAGSGVSYFPYYSDLDSDGNLGELHYLPTPPKDFFGNRPQYCSATYISNDGKTILGQVIDNRGFWVYPIVYKENEDGEWNYSLPSEILFNMDNLPLPEPLGEFDQEIPEPTEWMDAAQKAEWDKALDIWAQNSYDPAYSPYENLDLYLTDEQIEEYVEAVMEYNEAAEEYNEKNIEYLEKIAVIVDSSVFFERNSMALSGNGEWMTSSQIIDKPLEDPLDLPEYLYRPWLFNLNSREILPMADAELNLGISQAFDNGDVICVTPVASVLPPRSWLYRYNKKNLISFEDYIKEVNPTYGNWYSDNLSAYIPVAENPDGSYKYEFATITGLVTSNDDLTMICGGIIGDAIKYMYNLTYIFSDLPAGVEGIVMETPEDGYNVYNLQGVKVYSGKDPMGIQGLPGGIYIINGKKVMLNR